MSCRQGHSCGLAHQHGRVAQDDPVRIRLPQPAAGPSNISIAITPDGKTAYVACESAVIPISTATNTPGKPIPVPLREPGNIAITP